MVNLVPDLMPARAISTASAQAAINRLRRGKVRGLARTPGGDSEKNVRSEEHTSELQSPMDLVCLAFDILSLHDALPICRCRPRRVSPGAGASTFARSRW